MTIDVMKSAVVSVYSGDLLQGWSLHILPNSWNRHWGFEVDWTCGEVDIGCGPLFRYQRY